jgi:hypothetical protein
METYKELHKALGKPEKQSIPPESFFKKLPKKSDEDLIKLWKEDGFAAYGGGLFWTVDPYDFKDINKDWKAVKPGSIVFARNAFGDLFLLDGGEVFVLRVGYGELGNLGPSAYIFLNSTLKEKSLKESYLEKKLFEKVRKLAGELEPDECYGLFPALPLGGDDEDPKAYRRVKLQEYLASLSQMHE